MSAVQFVPQGSCLLAHTVRTLLDQEPGNDYRRFVVVLPTARLGHYLLSALAAGGEGTAGQDAQQRAILPPTVVTLAGFFRLLDPAPEGRALGPAALALTLKRLISAESHQKVGGMRHIHPHHAGELLVLYKELMENGLWDDWFQTLTDYIAGECYHHPLHLDSIMARFTEVHGLLERWRSQLADAQLTPQVDADNARAARVATALLEGAEGPQAVAGHLSGRTVIAAGLTSMAPSWLKVWRALVEWGAERKSEREAVQFIFPEPPPLSSGDHPMTPLLDSVGAKPRSAAAQKGAAAQKAAAIRRAPEDIVVVEAEDAIAEVAWVVRHVAQLLEGDLSPSQIAILVPSESQYSSLVAGGLREAGFSYNAAIAQPLSAATFGSWWLAFAEALAQPNAPLLVFGALRHPLTIKLILKGQASSAPSAFGPRFWQRIYEAFTAHKPLPERMTLSVVTERVAEAYPEDLAPWRVLADGFAELVAMTGENNPAAQAYSEPTQQLKKALNWVYDHGLSPQQRNEPLEESAYRGIADLLDQLTLVPNTHTSPAAERKQSTGLGTEGWQHILEANQTLAIRVVGEPMAGVQILSLAEARWLPVQVAFVLGCNEGFFPRALPSDELIGDSLKKRLGLKGWQGLEAMEDLSYSLMSARIPKVFLCRPLSFAGEETVPSRFVEQLRGEGHHPQIFVEAGPAPQESTASSSPHLDEGHGREGVFPKAWTGDWLNRLSATATDRFLGCPYRYAIDRLRLTDIESPLKDESAQQQGQLLHTILQDFHEGQEAIQLPPLPATLARGGGEQALMDRLVKLLNHYMSAEERCGPDGVQLREVGFARYVDHVLTLSATTGDTVRLVRGASERDIGAQGEAGSSAEPQAAAQLGSATRQLIGQIDRIDHIDGGLVITDFKRKGVMKTVADGIPSAQLLLYAKALEALEEGMSTERMILGYWSILKGEWEVLAVGAEVRETAREKGLATSRTPTIAELWAKLDAGFSAREEQVSPGSPVGGHYFADDSACGFCSYAGLCRKNDPGWQSQPTTSTLVQPYAQTGSEEGHA